MAAALAIAVSLFAAIGAAMSREPTMLQRSGVPLTMLVPLAIASFMIYRSRQRLSLLSDRQVETKDGIIDRRDFERRQKPRTLRRPVATLPLLGLPWVALLMCGLVQGSRPAVIGSLIMLATLAGALLRAYWRARRRPHRGAAGPPGRGDEE